MASYGTSGVRESWVDRTAAGSQDPLLLLARVLLGAIFVESGFGKLMDIAGFAAGLEGMGLPFAYGLAAIGAAVECFGGLAVVLGAWTRIAAAAVIVFTILATLLAHRYWEYPEAQQTMQHIQFMKNLAIVGGLFGLIATGGGRYSVDGVRRRA